jgi:hypothetical protein
VKTIPEVLIEAADLLDEKGWCQHRYIAPDGRMCVRGAIGKAAGIYDPELTITAPREVCDLYSGASWALTQYLIGRKILSEDINELIGWNDYLCQDKEQVTTALRSCVAELTTKEKN